MFNIGVLLSLRTDDYDSCYAKCGYHKMNEQQKTYFKHIGGKSRNTAANHFVCFIQDQNGKGHNEPVCSDLNEISINLHYSSHSTFVQRYILLSNFCLVYLT